MLFSLILILVWGLPVPGEGIDFQLRDCLPTEFQNNQQAGKMLKDYLGIGPKQSAKFSTHIIKIQRKSRMESTLEFSISHERFSSTICGLGFVSTSSEAYNVSLTPPALAYGVPV